jgi:hypothetical protein
MRIESGERFGPIFQNVEDKIFKNLKKNAYNPSVCVCQTGSEAFILALASYNSASSDGNIIEIGSLHGGSAEIILNSKPKNKKLFVCDTFEGLKDVSKTDLISSELKNGDIFCHFDQFSSIVKSHPDVIIKKGYFPDDSINDFEDEKFSLVHLDVDTYESTLKCLNFLHNKMSKNALIIVHDYDVHLFGVTKAVNEFCSEKNMENHYVDNLSNCQTLISYA